MSLAALEVREKQSVAEREENEEQETLTAAGTAAVLVWTAEEGRRYIRRPQPPYALQVPKLRTCGDKTRQILAKAEELAVTDTGYRILRLWVPDDAFTGTTYYIVPIKTRLRGRKRTCIRIFADLDDAVHYALNPPRGTEPA
ncbi:hypothetical protein [Hyperthermus butylicus]|uniref:Uncharacterized protein n=1 Tax=Hyperthermus butylicus (strain DSM 5456 / JCM 9403 / PLM1-5) TaxID=415426 RepID=A2BJ48_HYPBU|nr:hypothetical protein [Hyperthermus butylicus]ABM80009.1 hypothetical protein Hbut_0134 [Hyperthermus butylicus DSM 5456]